VREHRPAHDVADRPDAGHVGRQWSSTSMKPRSSGARPTGLQRQAVGIGDAADRDDQPIDIQRLRRCLRRRSSATRTTFLPGGLDRTDR
jgi:hypothetical protein